MNLCQRSLAPSSLISTLKSHRTANQSRCTGHELRKGRSVAVCGCVCVDVCVGVYVCLSVGFGAGSRHFAEALIQMQWHTMRGTLCTFACQKTIKNTRHWMG